MEKHSFQLSLDWKGPRTGVGQLETKTLKTQVSVPSELKGPGIGTNPEEMLLAAAATCYTATLAAMLGFNKIEQVALTVKSEAIVAVAQSGALTYEKIIHRPHIVLAADTIERTLSLVERIAKKAETACMISKALAGNVELELDIKITLDE